MYNVKAVTQSNQSRENYSIQCSSIQVYVLSQPLLDFCLLLREKARDVKIEQDSLLAFQQNKMEEFGMCHLNRENHFFSLKLCQQIQRRRQFFRACLDPIYMIEITLPLCWQSRMPMQRRNTKTFQYVFVSVTVCSISRLWLFRVGKTDRYSNNAKILENALG